MADLNHSKRSEYGPLASHEDADYETGSVESLYPKPSYLHDLLKVSHNSILMVLLSLATGLLFGFVGGRSTTSGLREFGITSMTPIPREVFTERKEVPFIPYREYMGPSKEAARNWARLTEASDSIYLDKPATYGLNDPGIRAPFFIFNEPPKEAASLPNLRNFYVLNNMHELHCVHMIRMRYNALVYESDTTDPLADTPIDKDWIDHLEHCFEYLRLSITCGDHMTLESDSPPGSPREYWEDGLSWGVVHSCINWDRLIQFQEDQLIAYNESWGH